MSRKKGVIFSYILMIIESLSSILFTPYLIRCLGQEEYGIYGLVASVTAYLYLLDLGVGNAIVRYMAKFRFNGDRKSERNMMAITVIFYTIVALLIVGIGQVLNYYIPQIFGAGLSSIQQGRAKEMLQITVTNAALTLFFAPFTKVLIAYEKFVLSKCIDITKILLRVSLCCVALYFGGKGVAIVSVNMAMTLLSGLICLLYVVMRLRVYPKLVKIEKSFVMEIFGYSFFVMLQMVATQINSMVDHILIGALVAGSATILAIYTAATQITHYFQSFGTAVNGVLMPGVVKMVEQKANTKAIQNEMIKVSRLIFMFLGLVYIGFAVCGKNFMQIWAGEGYEEGYYVALLIMLPMLISLSQSIGTQILWAMNKHKTQAVLKICIAVANVFLTILLIRWQPIIGAALGTMIALLLGDVVVMNIVFQKDIGISMWQFYKGTLKGVLPCLFISLICGLLVSLVKVQGWLGLCIEIVVMCVAYFIPMWLFGMNTTEKNMIRKILILRKK